eukprot:1143177-Pelagomonas_calceolata.AAC.3
MGVSTSRCEGDGAADQPKLPALQQDKMLNKGRKGKLCRQRILSHQSRKKETYWLRKSRKSLSPLSRDRKKR